MAQDNERLFVTLEARINQFEKQMNKAERTATGVHGKMRQSSKRTTSMMEADMNRSTISINRALASTTSQIGMFGKAFAAGLVGAGVAGFTRNVRESIAELSEMGKQMDRVGLSGQAFQELQFGFELAGVAQSEFITGMEQFTKRIGEASQGTGKLHEILEANGVAIRDQNGEIRSSEALLRDYAELIKNASSAQERMTLATEAFGRGGASFVNALSTGSAGIDQMATAADQAGGTIDEKLIRRAEELDDRFTALGRNLQVQATTSFVVIGDAAFTLADQLAGVGASLDKAGDRLSSWLVTADQARSFVEYFQNSENPLIKFLTPGDMTLLNGEGDTDNAPSVDRAGGGPRRGGPRRQATTVLPSADATDDPQTTTTPPRAGSTQSTAGARASNRNAAAEAAIREAEAVEQLISQLQFERDMVGKSEVEKEQANALRQAGSAATDEQRQQLTALIDEIERETTALQQSEAAQTARDDALAYGFGLIEDGLTSVATRGEDAADVIKRLALEFALAAAQAALLGTGPLSGVIGSFGLGSGGGSPLVSGAIAAGGVGLYANGGYVSGPGTGKSDSINARLSNGEFVVNAQDTSRFLPQLEAMNRGQTPNMGGGASNVHVTVGVSADANGNLMPFVESVTDQRVGAAIARNNVALRKQMPKMVHAAQQSNKQRGRR